MLDQPVPNPLAKNPNVHTHKVFASVGMILAGLIIVLFGGAIAFDIDIADIFVSKPSEETITKVSTSSAKQATDSAKKEEKDETADWAIYSDPKNLVSFKHPNLYECCGLFIGFQETPE